MTTSRTTTKTTNMVGSIPITGGTEPQPLDPTRPITLSASDEEWELEKEKERNRERLRKLKEKRKAKEVARKKAGCRKRAGETGGCRLGRERQESGGRGGSEKEADGGSA
ncbi:hypothetical protein EV359DRAFT_82271 [Lentinula novae-zelandiae]|nr:hypothetical protein EV359DRAFT_82271 [Lentinula novae-zelandiae]